VVSRDPTILRLPVQCINHLTTGIFFLGIRTFAMTTRSARLFDKSFATSKGLVSHVLPFLSDPFGRVTVISSRGCAVAGLHEIPFDTV